ncbi:MAG: hypothetical protein AAFX99_12500, partial [Myxococcota bacterium]
ATVKDITGSAKAVPAGIQPKIELGADGVSLSIEGLDREAFDVDRITERLLGRVNAFYDNAVNAPGRVASISTKVRFQVEFLAALTQSFSKLAGTRFSETPKFVVGAQQ